MYPIQKHNNKNTIENNENSNQMSRFSLYLLKAHWKYI